MSEGNIPIDYNFQKHPLQRNQVPKIWIMTKYRSLHFCLLDPPVFVLHLSHLTGK